MDIRDHIKLTLFTDTRHIFYHHLAGQARAVEIVPGQPNVEGPG